MTTVETTIRDALSAASRLRVGDDGSVRVPTTTLLPGGDALSLLVTPEPSGRFRVTDAGAARDALLEAGIHSVRRGDRRKATDLAKRAGIEIDGDAFLLRGVDAGQLPSAIAYVAETSRAWAQAVLEHVTRATERQISDVVQERLERAFGPARIAREVPVLGDSNTRHVFDFLVKLDDERQAAFEIVTPFVQSIASTHLKFSDIRRVHEAWPREAVIESSEVWSAENIALLSQAASHVRPVDVDWRDLQALAA